MSVGRFNRFNRFTTAAKQEPNGISDETIEMIGRNRFISEAKKRQNRPGMK
jgi:hypothetical protein